MKVFKIVILVLIAGLVGIQFFPASLNQNTTMLPIDFTKIFNTPDKIQSLLKKTCYDCHSNNTIYPWYSKVQPFAWLMESHIIEGKEELNFSEFGAYSKRRQKSKLKSIISQIKDDEMPLSSYTLIHRNAILSEKDKEILEKWFTTIRDDLNKK